MIYIALAGHALCMVFAIAGINSYSVLAFGFLMNIFCGIIAGYYLRLLAQDADKEHKAEIFGRGYGAAIAAVWLLSRIDSIYYSWKVLFIYMVITCVIIAVVKIGGSLPADVNRNLSNAGEVSPAEVSGNTLNTEEVLRSDKACDESINKVTDKGRLARLCILVLLMSVINSIGFSFPSDDIGSAVNIELFRLIYAAGLIIAGIITDRSRKNGAVCALAALVIPFFLLGLRGEQVSQLVFWGISYLIFGFYTVYRIILFADAAGEKGLLYLSGFGLMTGRIGDAAGEWLCLCLYDRPVLHLVTALFLFACVVPVFFSVYHERYEEYKGFEAHDKSVQQDNRFYLFASQHELSSREQEIMKLLIERKTNAEIAETLCISESTVKFHVRNLLQKTESKNRNDLVTSYLGGFK